MSTSPGTLYVILGASIRALLDSGESSDEVRRGVDLAFKASTTHSSVAEAATKAFQEIIADELGVES